jgi:hypothetical protein
MKQRLIVPIFLLSLGLGRSLMAQASFHYECMSDSAVGYAFDESMRSWKPTEFQKGKSSYSGSSLFTVGRNILTRVAADRVCPPTDRPWL